jgi:D-alanine-D-alanine ligase
MKVAVVRNRSRDGVINLFGQPCPEVYGKKAVQMTIDALREAGHTVAVLEGDKTLFAKLEEFMPPDADGRPAGMVFNMAYGVQGKSRYTHVPAMLEMAGVPYTGADPLGHAIALDKVVTKIQMRDAGVPTPNYKVVTADEMHNTGLRFPLVVKPRHESTSYGLRLVETPAELQEAVLAVVTAYQQDALVEEYIDGREVAVAVLGNEPADLLPLVEFDFKGRSLRAVTWGDKYHKQPDEPQKLCPAPVDEKLAERLRAIALATFRACHCRDYSRVDIRIDPSGNPFVLEINSMASLGTGGAYVLAARTAGYTFPALISRILDLAHQRYFGTPAPRDPKVSQPEQPNASSALSSAATASPQPPASRTVPQLQD